LPFNIWTINRLRLYLDEQTNILLSYSRFRALLSKLNYRWKQPKHDLAHLQDQSAKETVREILDWLKKTSPSTALPKPSSSLWTKRP
jgi:transposase